MLTVPPDKIADCFSAIDFTDHRYVVVAISGGSDSCALLGVLLEHLASQAIECNVLAVTVDHGLRAESAAEAEKVSALCTRLGVPHKTVRWHHDGAQSGLQQRARMARYQLLAQAARAHNGSLVLTGHTLDDQLETYTMRTQRAAGLGQAGIAPATCFERMIWFVRPLLDIKRDDLRLFLQDRDIDWIDDPSNFDEKFERARIRKHGADVLATHTIAHAQVSRVHRATVAATLIDDSQLVPSLTRDSALLIGDFINREGASDLLAILLSLIGVKEFLPAKNVLQQAMEFCDSAPNGAKLTLHGCLLNRIGGQFYICRESRNGGQNHFGFDRLMPSFDLALADAIYRRLGEAELPPCPLK